MKLSLLLWCLTWCLNLSEFLTLTNQVSFSQAQPQQVISSIIAPRTPVSSLSVSKDSSAIPGKTLTESPLPSSQQPSLLTSFSLTKTIIAATIFIIMIVSIYMSLKEIIKERFLSGSNSRLSGHDDIQARANHRKHLKKSGHESNKPVA